MKIKKDDNVLVISGKDRLKQGKIVQTFPDKNKILISGINIAKKSAKPTKKNPKGGIMEISKPISASNVMLLCTKCQKPTRVGFIFKDKKKVRICRICKEEIE
jgi:large subunit ribosomal protein L24